ncbi:UNVERIFIED_CONTAM: hypothetical protein K2H54_016050 [Gekko kuhli]
MNLEGDPYRQRKVRRRCRRAAGKPFLLFPSLLLLQREALDQVKCHAVLISRWTCLPPLYLPVDKAREQTTLTALSRLGRREGSSALKTTSSFRAQRCPLPQTCQAWQTGVLPVP